MRTLDGRHRLGRRPGGTSSRPAGYSGGWTIEGPPRPVPPSRPGRRAHDHARARHVDRRGVRPQPDDARPPRLGPAGVLRRPLHPRSRESQIKPHITKRFSMPWSHPAPRMRELILAIRAIWDTWLNGTPLQFRGEFYTHTLMTPFFTPKRLRPRRLRRARIFLAGVGPVMTEVAGEVCDGFICHGFTTERYLREVTLPALERGRAQGRQDAGRASRSAGRASSSPASDERGRGGRRSGTAPADRLLRVDSGVPCGARAARLGRSAGRAQPAVEGGRVGADGRADRRRDAQRVRRRRPSPRRSAPALAERYGDVVTRIIVLRPVPQ